MAVEIERKFLVKQPKMIDKALWIKHIKQAYILLEPTKHLRIRLIDSRAVLGIKALVDSRDLMVRKEFEYEIPLKDADDLFELAVGKVIEKKRYGIALGNLTIELDVFEGNNSGLVLAELELPDQQTYPELPDWLGAEVTHDKRYTNVYLALNPFNQWKK